MRAEWWSPAARTGGAVLLVVGLGACSDVEPIVDCKPEAGIHPICGLHKPEDLAAVPDQEMLVASQMGQMDGSEPGSLAVISLEDEAIIPLFPAPTTTRDTVAEATWGGSDCPGPPTPAFSPHGVDLVRRGDRALELFVVNHGGRESVEMFELRAEEGGTLVAIWRGCAIAPEAAFLNDVVGRPDGSFFTTHMYPRSSGLRATLHLIRGMLGMSTGYVLSWTPEAGFERVPGTKARFPNGIALSPDRRSLFVAMTLANEVRRIDLETGELEAVTSVQGPDNLTWTADGCLLVASHTASGADLSACQNLERGACPAAFAIVELDPVTLEPTTILEHEGPPMGAGTVGLRVGDELFIGSFAGDRIGRVALAPSGRERFPTP